MWRLTVYKLLYAYDYMEAGDISNLVDFNDFFSKKEMDIIYDGYDNWKKKYKNTILYKDRKPCNHIGCPVHITHPCECCGRIGARGEVYEPIRFLKET